MSSSKGIGLSQSGQDTDRYGGSMPAAQAPLINLTDFPLVLFVTLQLHKTDASVNGHSTAELWGTMLCGPYEKLFFYSDILKYSGFGLKLDEILVEDNIYL